MTETISLATMHFFTMFAHSEKHTLKAVNSFINRYPFLLSNKTGKNAIAQKLNEYCNSKHFKQIKKDYEKNLSVKTFNQVFSN